MGLEMAGWLICAPAPRDSETGTPILTVYLDHCHSLCLSHPHCPLTLLSPQQPEVIADT